MLVLLAILVFVYYFSVSLYFLVGLDTLPAVEFLYVAGVPCGAVWWLQSDVRRSAAKRVYCQGVLMHTAWPFVIAYHLLKTRGLKGFLQLLALIASFIASQILAAVVYVLVST